MKRQLYILAILVLTSQLVYGRQVKTPKDIQDAVAFLQTDCPDSLKTLPYNYKNDYLAAGNRFDSVAVFSIEQLDTIKGVYGLNTDYKKVTHTLPFTFYAPKKSLDTMSKRPFIMLIHGGGFINGSHTSLEAVARSFAVRGYAAATIGYRKGFKLGAIPCLMGDSVELLKAVYRATQDANAAMRYFVAHADTLGIDTDQLFLFGSSAGSVTTTSMIYYPQSFFDAQIPNLQATLGALHNASNAIEADFQIQAELTTSGYALLDREQMTVENSKPAFYMQGSRDPTLPIRYGPVLRCPIGKYGHSYGSSAAKEILKGLKYPYEQYIDEGAEHSLSAHYPSTFYVKRMTSFIKRLWKADYRFIAYNTFDKVYDEHIK